MSAYRPDVYEMAHALACPRCGVAVVVADDDDTLCCHRCDARFAIAQGTVRTDLAAVSRSPAPVHAPREPLAATSLVRRESLSALKVLLGIMTGTVCMLIAGALDLGGILVAVALCGPMLAGLVAASGDDRRRVEHT